MDKKLQTERDLEIIKWRHIYTSVYEHFGDKIIKQIKT